MSRAISRGLRIKLAHVDPPAKSNGITMSEAMALHKTGYYPPHIAFLRSRIGLCKVFTLEDVEANLEHYHKRVKAPLWEEKDMRRCSYCKMARVVSQSFTNEPAGFLKYNWRAQEWESCDDSEYPWFVCDRCLETIKESLDQDSHRTIEYYLDEIEIADRALSIRTFSKMSPVSMNELVNIIEKEKGRFEINKSSMNNDPTLPVDETGTPKYLWELHNIKWGQEYSRQGYGENMKEEYTVADFIDWLGQESIHNRQIQRVKYQKYIFI